MTIAAWGLFLIPSIRKHFPKDKGIAFMGLILLLSNLYQLILWIGFNKGYEYLQIHLAVTMCLGLWLLCFCLKSFGGFTKYMWFGTVIGILSLACVLLLTNLDVLSSIPHALLASICMLALFAYIGKQYPKYIYNNEYKLWQESIPEDSNVLVATNNVQSVNTVQYMFQKANVCHYSVIDPASYNENLLVYWERYPEKSPEIIVVDCWYGNLLFAEDSWIMQYIENDFEYTEVIEGDYVRIYKK